MHSERVFGIHSENKVDRVLQLDVWFPQNLSLWIFA